MANRLLLAAVLLALASYSCEPAYAGPGTATPIGPFNGFRNISASNKKVAATRPDDTVRFLGAGGLSVTGTSGASKSVTFSGAAFPNRTSVVNSFNGRKGTVTPQSGDYTAAQVGMARIGSSTYSTAQHLQDIFHSAGYVSGGAITDAGGGSVNVAAGTGLIRATNSAIATVYYFDWPASNGLAITANSIRYIGVEYNSGSPQVTVRTSMNWNYRTDFPLGRVVNESGTLQILVDPQAVGDHASTMIQREYETMPLAPDMRGGGLTLGETGTRNVTVSAGALWDRLNKYALTAINTSASGSFDAYYRDGAGGFTKTAGLTQWPNTQYDNNSGTLQTLSANKWANLWFYIETDNDLVMVYGQGSYSTLAAALVESPPATVPNRITAHGRLIGRIVFQKSSATAGEIDSAFSTVFSATGVTNHANLSNLDYASSGHTGFEPTITTGTSAQFVRGDKSVSALASGDIPNNAANTTGSAAKLTTARTINGVSFDGTANIGQDLQTSASPSFTGGTIVGASQAVTTTWADAGTNDGALLLKESTSSSNGNKGGGLLFGAGQGFFAFIKSGVDSSTGPSGTLRFGTRATTGSITTRMLIDGNGLIGIGTTSPHAALDIGGAVRLSTDATACSSTNRGAIRYTAGAAGVADKFEACVKSSADAYAWLAIYTAP
jgi:hypothetical protein